MAVSGHVIDPDEGQYSRPCWLPPWSEATAARKWLAPTRREASEPWRMVGSCKDREMFGQHWLHWARAWDGESTSTDCGRSDACRARPMANRQNQARRLSNSPCSQGHPRLPVTPPQTRVSTAHHGCITVAVSEGPDHGPVPASGTRFHISPQSIQR